MGRIAVPRLALVAFAHMSGQLMSQFSGTLSLRELYLSLRVWSTEQAMTPSSGVPAHPRNGQDGTRLLAPSIVLGYKGLSPCFVAGFAAPWGIAKTMLGYSFSILVPKTICPGYILPWKLHF
ncbi:hypothetical protein BTVI_27117 [Pitangus sulphuratus]|nr:hypothetical protein BTVI_27117 [Pitangus sulphuratus]